MEWFNQDWAGLVSLFDGQLWVVSVSAILVATALLDLVQRLTLRLLQRGFKQKNKVWITCFIDALRAPFSFFIWVTGTVLAMITVIEQLSIYTGMIPYIQSFKSTILTLAVGWFVIRLVRRLEVHLKRYASEDHRFDEVTIEALSKIIKLLAFVLTGLFFLSSFGVSLTGLLAFGGVGGIAVGFAAKDLLGNVLGGLMLYLDKPFTVGEWIRSADKEIEGNVEEIGWRMTTVRTFDKRPLYIPNGIFANIAIENPSRMTNRRIRETVGIRYSDIDKMRIITSEIRQMLIDHPEIDETINLIVRFNQYGPSSLDFLINTFTKTTDLIDFHAVKEDVLLKVSEIVSAHGAQIAFPTRTLFIENTPEDSVVPSATPVLAN